MVATDPCSKNDLRELLVDYRMPIGCLQNLLQCINDILTNEKFQVKAENVYVTFGTPFNKLFQPKKTSATFSKSNNKTPIPNG